jgi:aspartyl-tRNA(Asn)/glutamyl-tRNA(Gln) amidotransferase subunit A
MNSSIDTLGIGADIQTLAQAVKNKQIRAVDLVKKSQEQIQRLNPQINAVLWENSHALAQAEAIDAKIARGEPVGALAGIPFGVKDNYCTKGLKTTAASRILENFVPPYSATVVERLEQAGAVIVGKLNLDEFAMGSTNENSAFGPVKNPWDLTRVAGGSSGGSAAAVAARMVSGSVGTDTGGSIRMPAHFCGITGIKPTYGRVSRYGIVAYASSLDQAGPMARSPKDCALLLEAISGHDPKDATSSNRSVPAWSKNISTDMKGLKIGVPKEFMADAVQPSVKKTVNEALAFLKDRGATTVDIELPLTKYSIAVYYIVATSEASSNLARYDGVRFGKRVESSDLDEMYRKSRGQGFGPEVLRRLMIGTYALSSGYYDAYYLKACQVRSLIQSDMHKALGQCDVILGPVSTRPAVRLGEQTKNPIESYLNDIFTTSTNLAGLPGISVPAGFTDEGLPVGVQIMAPAFEEQRLFNVAQAIYEFGNTEKRAPNGI